MTRHDEVKYNSQCFVVGGSVVVGVRVVKLEQASIGAYDQAARAHALSQHGRQEVEAQAVIKQNDGHALDVGALKSRCPLLLSVFQETQRVRHIHAAIRRVMKDTLLDGKYLLKEGNYLQMPGHSIHSNTSIWGPSAREFDPYRFIKAEKLLTE